MASSWTFGGDPTCDIVLNQQSVSRRHARLSRDTQGYLLEDLGSTNGTFVNGQRISGAVRVSSSDAITLGQIVPLPWPAETGSGSTSRPKTVRIGREPDNDIVIDLPIVSGYHARVVRDAKTGRAVLEDLGSSNGTFANSRENRITSHVLSPGDTIFFGSHPMPAASILARFDPAPAMKRPNVPTSVDIEPALATTRAITVEVPSLAPAERGPVLSSGWRFGLLAGQGGLVGLLIMALGTSQANAVAGTLFGLSLASVWFGLSSAVFGLGMGAEDENALRPAGLAMFGGAALLQCVLAWAMVVFGLGLRADALGSLAFLLAAGAVGFATGCVIVLVAPKLAYAGGILAGLVLILWLFGGEYRPMPSMPGGLKVISASLPSRWAFEGLLLLESDRRPAAPEGRDIAEGYFPVESERMGIKADVIALTGMLLGWAALAAFLEASLRSSKNDGAALSS